MRSNACYISINFRCRLFRLPLNETNQEAVSVVWVSNTFGTYRNGALPADPACESFINPNATAAPSGVSPDYCLAAAAQVYKRALAEVNGWFGVVPTLGEMQVMVHDHQLLGSTALACFVHRERPKGGSKQTVNVIGSRAYRPYSPAGVISGAQGASYREIVDLSDMDNSMFISTLGNAEQMFSRFFDNFFSVWSVGQLFPMRTHNIDVAMTLDLTP